MTQTNAAPAGAPGWAAPEPPEAPPDRRPSAPARAVAGAAPKAAIPRKVTCPVCATRFGPRATAGRCPVCGEQVVPADEAANAVPVIGPFSKWLFQDGNWRLAAVAALVLYQIILFIVLWIHLAQTHAL